MTTSRNTSQPSAVPQSELPEPLPRLADPGSPEIVDMAERVKAAYVDWGLLMPGDGFQLSYDRVEVRHHELQLAPIDPRKGEPLSLHSIDYSNDTEREQTIKYAEAKKTTASVSASVSAGFKYNMKLSGKVSLKKILEIGGENSYEFSVSSTLTTAMSVEQQWSWEMPIIVPARSRITAMALVSRYYVEPSFSMDIEISVAPHPNFDPGYNPLYVAITRQGTTTWYRSSLSGALNPDRGGGFSPGRDHNHVRYRCQGKFTGAYGRDLMIRVRQFPVGAGATTPKSEQILRPDAGLASAAHVTTLGAPEVDNQHAPAASREQA